jgi:hypothetical protein
MKMEKVLPKPRKVMKRSNQSRSGKNSPMRRGAEIGRREVAGVEERDVTDVAVAFSFGELV